MTLHHVEIYVSDLARTLEFWGWLLTELGYEPYQEWDAVFSYRSGPTYLVFVQTEPRFLADGYHRRRVGLNHLAFHGGPRERVAALADQLRERGTTMLYPERGPFAGGDGHYALFFEDPDRIKVEVVASA